MIKESLAQEPVDFATIDGKDSLKKKPRVRFGIRTKITLPFLLLALGLALGAAYIVTRIVFDTIEERYTNDLIASGKLVVEGMIRHEDDLLGQLRLFSHTTGVAAALEDQDADRLFELSIGIAANNNEEFVDFLDKKGDLVLSLRQRVDGEIADYEASRVSDIDYKALSFVKNVLDKRVDSEGDKFAGLLRNDQTDYLTIAGPVISEGEFFGVVLVGKSLPNLLRQLHRETLAQVTLYDRSGQPLASTLVNQEAPVLPLDKEKVESIIANQDWGSLKRYMVPSRDMTVSTVYYGEILGPWEVRNGADLGVIGVALPYSFLFHASLPTRIEVTGLATGMILLVVILGIAIARIITRPLGNLVRASSEVSGGNLSVHIEPKGNDEIAVLTEAFNQMVANLHHSKVDLLNAYDGTLEGWSKALELRDRETNGHTRRVTELTIDLARIMGIDDLDLINIRRGALLHDIGKMGIPDTILLKPGMLTAEEWKIMRNHPLFAYNMLWPIEYLRPAIDIPYCHHERWDGNGYPRGLRAEEIPLAARVFAIVDVWDAMRSDRPYRAALPEDAVCDYIFSSAGSHFDPQVVDAFFDLIARRPCQDNRDSE